MGRGWPPQPPRNPGRLRNRHRVPTYIKGGSYDLRMDVGKDELQRIRRDLHNILWGGGSTQNELFFNLVGLFLVKIYDEKETEDGKPYDFQVFFIDGEPEPAEKLYERMNDLYFLALTEYLHYSEEDLRKVKDIVFDARKVRYVVEVLQGISFTTNRFDVIGDFFEGIVRGEFKQSKGQYLTHTNLVRFMVQGLQLGALGMSLVDAEKRLPYIIDPACGSSAFLIESMKAITDHVTTNPKELKQTAAVQEFVKGAFPDYRANAWAREYIYGIEVNGDLAVASKVNMVGHGDGSANIEARDALSPFVDFTLGRLQVAKHNDVYDCPVNEQFDAVLSNPPFSVTVDRDTARTFPENFVRGEAIVKSLKGSSELEVPTELLFIERYYQLLKARGRLAVILPESVFDAASTRDVRLFILKYFRLVAVVSLPVEAFAPYTMTKTAILFAEKRTEAEVREWEQLAEEYRDAYRDLMADASAYFEAPALTQRVRQVIESYTYAAAAEYDAAFATEVANRVVDVVESSGSTEDIVAIVADAIVESFSELTEDEGTLLRRVIARKKSLPSAIAEYQSRVQSREHLVEVLHQVLGDAFDPSHEALSVGELVREYAEDVKDADEQWWVFRQVADAVDDTPVLFARADEVGYKRGVRGEDDRPNELFAMVGAEETASGDTPSTILDALLSVAEWRKPE